MRIVSNKALRRTVNALLGLLPRKYQVAADQWLRGRQEFRKLQAADYVVVSFGKSGRTWLRTMISRHYQVRHQLPEGSIIGFDNFHKACAEIPRIFFTHDHYLKYYTGHQDSKQDYYGKKIILLVRDPRDVAVSNFFQRKYRASELTRRLYTTGQSSDSIYDYVLRYSMPLSISFLNAWGREIDRFKDVLVIRYEDLREDTGQHLARVLRFLDAEASPAEVEEIVAYARFENMKKREKGPEVAAKQRRLFGGDASNPDSYKVRRGKIGGYVDYFSDQEIEVVNRVIQTELVSLYHYS